MGEVLLGHKVVAAHHRLEVATVDANTDTHEHMLRGSMICLLMESK